MSSGEELALARRAAEGDSEAFRRLVNENQAAVYRYSLTLVRRREDAEDVLQEVFLSLLKHVGAFRGESSLKTWLLTITRNTAFRLRKNAARRPEDSTDLEELGRAAGWGTPDPERIAIGAEQREKLRAAIESLAPEDREVLVLCDLEEQTVQSAATTSRISLAAAKSRLHRARLRLAARLRQEVAQ